MAVAPVLLVYGNTQLIVSPGRVVPAGPPAVAVLAVVGSVPDLVIVEAALVAALAGGTGELATTSAAGTDTTPNSPAMAATIRALRPVIHFVPFIGVVTTQPFRPAPKRGHIHHSLCWCLN